MAVVKFGLAQGPGPGHRMIEADHTYDGEDDDASV